MLLYTDIWHLTPRNPFSSVQWEYIDVSRDLHFTFFLKIFYLMHMSVCLDVCLCTTCMRCTVPREARWMGQVPWSWRYRCHELPYWKPNLRPWQEHQGLLTTELSLRCPAYFLCQISFIIKVYPRVSAAYRVQPGTLWHMMAVPEGFGEQMKRSFAWWHDGCLSVTVKAFRDVGMPHE